MSENTKKMFTGIIDIYSKYFFISISGLCGLSLTFKIRINQ